MDLENCTLDLGPWTPDYGPRPRSWGEGLGQFREVELVASEDDEIYIF